jgi:hypothetical protein
MSHRRILRVSLAAALAATLLPACRRNTVEINPIVPAMKVSRERAPLGSALEVTYTWTTEAGAKKIPPGYQAFAHVLDSRKTVLFTDDHVPVPPPDQWEPGKTYTYTRTVYVPVTPYVGTAQLVMGLCPTEGKGERIALKAEDIGMRAHKVGTLELLPQTENIFLVYKEGWYGNEATPENPIERTWTKKEALVSFKNPKRDVVLYLEADTNLKAFPQPPVLTVSVGAGTGLQLPIESSDVFSKKIRFKADQLGQDEWVDLRLALSQSFVPKTMGINQDERELGLLVYHLYVGEADKLGEAAVGPTVVDAGPVTLPTPAAPAAAIVPASSKSAPKVHSSKKS